jgi:hypothetical protein
MRPPRIGVDHYFRMGFSLALLRKGNRSNGILPEGELIASVRHQHGVNEGVYEIVRALSRVLVRNSEAGNLRKQMIAGDALERSDRTPSPS